MIRLHDAVFTPPATFAAALRWVDTRPPDERRLLRATIRRARRARRHFREAARGGWDEASFQMAYQRLRARTRSRDELGHALHQAGWYDNHRSHPFAPWPCTHRSLPMSDVLPFETLATTLVARLRETPIGAPPDDETRAAAARVLEHPNCPRDIYEAIASKVEAPAYRGW